MLSNTENYDDTLLQQILVMKHQEETSYKCEDYLQTETSSSSSSTSTSNGKDHVRSLPNIALHLQQAAFEECAQFINTLVVDCTPPNKDKNNENRNRNKDNQISSKDNGNNNRDIDEGGRSKPENFYGDFLQVPSLGGAADEHFHNRPPHKPGKSPTTVFDSLVHISSSGPSMERSRSFMSSTSSHEDNSSSYHHCEDVRHLALWRRQMCKWAYRVVDAFGFYRVSAAVAFSILDRYICEIPRERHIAITRRDFVLLTITCLYLSIKTSEAKRKLSLFALIDMTRNHSFVADDIRNMEINILEALQWRVNPPIASVFVSPLLKLIDSRLRERSSYDEHQEGHMDSKQLQHIFVSAHRLLEVSYIDSKLVSKRPSSVAIAAILLASSRLKKNFCSHTFQIVDDSVSIQTYCNEVRNLLKIEIDCSEIKFSYRRLEKIYRRHFCSSSGNIKR